MTMDELVEDELYDEDPWAEDAPPVRRGLFARGRAWWRHRWNYYLQNAVPADDDDAPAGLPKFLHGARGRLIMGAVAVCVVAGWAVALVQIVT